MKKVIGLLTSLVLILPSITHAQLFRIDPSNSVVYTTYWNNWSWHNWGPPDDGVVLKVWGTFEVSITAGGINSWTGAQIPDRIAFTNVDVHSSSKSGRTWDFPDFKGFFLTNYMDDTFGPGFEGEESGCLEVQYTRPGGSCWYAGEVGSYEGTYDGQTITIRGGKTYIWTDSNSYQYVINATAVPEPAESAYLMAGLALLLIRLGLSRRHAGPSAHRPIAMPANA